MQLGALEAGTEWNWVAVAEKNRKGCKFGVVIRGEGAEGVMDLVKRMSARVQGIRVSGAPSRGVRPQQLERLQFPIDFGGGKQRRLARESRHFRLHLREF